MSDGTHIEWADATVNAVNGCSVVSPGCTNCYAMRLAGTRLKHQPSRAGLTRDSKAGPVWTGEVRLSEKALLEPLRWRQPRRIFWNAHGDLFHPSVPDEWIDRCFAVMALTPHHIHQVLTKRPERMRAYFADIRAVAIRAQDVVDNMEADGFWKFPGHEPWIASGWPLPNVWLGTSVEDQARADERIPDLLATPAAVRWLSMEPLLGPVNLKRWVPSCREATRPGGEKFITAEFFLTRCEKCGWFGSTELCDLDRNWDDADVVCAGCGEIFLCSGVETHLHWIVVGGESGSGARPMHPDWARSLRDQCAAAGVPFFFKQWGEFAPGEVAADRLDPDKAAKGVSLFDGRWEERWSYPDGHFDDEPDLYRIGKKAAGRLLDGVEHNGMPA